MKKYVWIINIGTIAIMSGCGGSGTSRNSDDPMAAMNAQMGSSADMMTSMTTKMNFSQEVMKNPDLPAWHAQRDKMALAVGDRVFDKGFDRVFDSMITALANLGCRVINMERMSGYLTASLPQLAPDQQEALHKEALAQYAQIKGYPSSVLSKQGAFDMDMDFSSMMERGGGAGLTLSMVRQSPRQTKVKLRFDGAYYPRRVDELYKKVWAEVDKQMFLDKALD
ncbi:MAG: hypothetical protein M3Q00_00545 [Pseudomonadota bacterium]|nr:hypothetical protein [Pseudomonadota bacterium]